MLFFYYKGTPNRYLTSIILLIKSSYKYNAEHFEPFTRSTKIKDKRILALLKTTTPSSLKRMTLADLKSAGIIEGSDRLYAFIKHCKESIEISKTNSKASCTELLSIIKNQNP